MTTHKIYRSYFIVRNILTRHFMTKQLPYFYNLCNNPKLSLSRQFTISSLQLASKVYVPGTMKLTVHKKPEKVKKKTLNINLDIGKNDLDVKLKMGRGYLQKGMQVVVNVKADARLVKAGSEIENMQSKMEKTLHEEYDPIAAIKNNKTKQSVLQLVLSPKVVDALLKDSAHTDAMKDQTSTDTRKDQPHMNATKGEIHTDTTKDDTLKDGSIATTHTLNIDTEGGIRNSDIDDNTLRDNSMDSEPLQHDKLADYNTKDSTTVNDGALNNDGMEDATRTDVLKADER